MSYSVYKHTFPNGKVYIGITSMKPNRRWDKGRGYNNQPLMKRAINKYGWDNVVHEILFSNLSKEEAERTEIELISIYQSNNSTFGYNIENGGNATGKMSEKTKRKISEFNKTRLGNKNSFYGKHHTEETKRKISEAKTGIAGHPHTEESRKKISESKKGANNHMYGKCHSEKTKKKMSESHRGENNHNYKKHLSEETRKKIGEANGNSVRCIETNTIYRSVKNASNETGVDLTGIHKCCKGRQNTSGGYHWEYVK